jgi:hypothetical protein
MELPRAFEGVAWALFLAAVALQIAGVVASARAKGVLRSLVAVVAVALVVRLAVPWTATHWYYTGGNVLGAPGVFDRASSYVPWIDRLVCFQLRWPWPALNLLHLAASIASIVLFWGTLFVLEAKAISRDLFAGILATTPVFVRYGVTESSHIWASCCFAAAAIALARSADGKPPRWDVWVLLAAAPILGGTIRLESAPLLGAAALFVLVVCPRARIGRPALDVFIVAAGAAVALAAHAHFGTLQLRVGLRPMWIAIGLLFRAVLQIHSIALVSPYPALLAVPIWYLVVQRIRARELRALSWMCVASVYCSGPFLFGQAAFFELGGAGYSIVALTFPALWAAEGIATALERARARYAGRTFLLLELGMLGAFGVIVVPGLFHTYAFMEEYRFLREALRGKRGTVLALFDRNEECDHDLDSSVALPDAVISATQPELSWIVLGADATVDPHELRFDYYYRGSELDLDPKTMLDWPRRLSNDDPRSQRCHAEHLERLRELDARVRATCDLDLVRSEVIVARTFSFIAFPGDRASLSLFRRTDERR